MQQRKYIILEPADITVTYTHDLRDVIVIPDDAAAAMHDELNNNWVEFFGSMYGESRQYYPGHWVYEATIAILTAFGASPVPPHEHQKSTDDAAVARAIARGDNGRLPCAILPIFGRSDWNEQTRDFVDRAGNNNLHLPGNPYVEHGPLTSGGTLLRYVSYSD